MKRARLSGPQEFPLAVLGGAVCRCGFPTAQFSLHEREDEEMCQRCCPGDEAENCGTDDYFLVYQTQVQGACAPRTHRHGVTRATEMAPHSLAAVQGRLSAHCVNSVSSHSPFYV